MPELELDSLELKIDQLIAAMQNMRLKNNSLNKKISDLNHENIMLLEKQKNSSNSLKKLILKLQDELACQTQK